MQKRRRWQLWVIFVVTVLTLYNIFPTIFYYTKPLKKPITAKQAEDISKSITKRVNVLEKDALDWTHSFCKLLDIKPVTLKMDEKNPQEILLSFSSAQEAKKLRTYLPKAGSLITFFPSQLSLVPQKEEIDSPDIRVQRKIPIRLEETLFTYVKKEESGRLTQEYKNILFDRVAEIALAIGGISENAIFLGSIQENPKSSASFELVYSFAGELINTLKALGENSPAGKRYLASITQGNFDKTASYDTLLSGFSGARENLRAEIKKLEQGSSGNSFQKEDLKKSIALLLAKDSSLAKADKLLKDHKTQILNSETPWNTQELLALLEQSSNSLVLHVGAKNPFIDEIRIDPLLGTLYLSLHNDLDIKQQAVEQLVYNEIANIAQKTGEAVQFTEGKFALNLYQGNSKSLLVLQLDKVAKIETQKLLSILQRDWNPTHPDLKREQFPILDFASYQALPPEQKSLCLVVYAPILSNSSKMLRDSSIYVLAKGLDRIASKYEGMAKTEASKEFFKDFNDLVNLLKQNGFLGYRGNLLASDLKSDFIFEKEDYYQILLKATREQFSVHGTKRYATLELSDYEQRILAENRIETQMHEDLLKWRDDYKSARVSLQPENRFDFPAPTKSILGSNFLLSMKKYLRGDERKVLKWGLDLSGGKTVQIELRDQNNRLITQEVDIRQGINELYQRVNKLGVSEVSIRAVGNQIVLDFPGSQGLSASELVKASTMYFHVVNEKFSSQNTQLADAVMKFLQEVWNEAVVSGKKDIESVNKIAWKHLYGDSLDKSLVQPRSESAKILYENGLKLASPFDQETSSLLNEELSKIAIWRGEDYSHWEGQITPLMIVFRNYALEGSNLENIRPLYDPSRGNYLTFEVKSSGKEGSQNPRNLLFAWTSRYAKEKVIGTSLETFSTGRGWRMAVILNDTIISAPHLEAALKDSAMITGSFTQREIQKLAADLKAGSLTFSPRILSEKNVSPELGLHERTQGIAATIIALAAVIALMTGYYRFAGLVASVAVLFNLLIMWATLQNIQATLSLAGIAGIILTVGMAVDANVLVNERIKEELLLTGKMATALQAGYKKAFNAILDSNVTTIIAALILLHFDSGPIKGFAVTLIIGIVSSMFTALFMTRTYFEGWVRKNKVLHMSNLIHTKNFDFLKNAKWGILASLIIIFAGSICLYTQRHNVLGMDFTGGYALSLDLSERPENNYRSLVEKALVQAGAPSQDIDIRELGEPNHLRLLLGRGLEEAGKPFYKMPLSFDRKDITYLYENNPRIVWTVNALKKAHLDLNPQSLSRLDSSWMSMSGQMSDTMRNHAIIGLLIAFLGIFIYLSFRFEYKFSISAILCTIHDIFISVGAISLLNACGLPIQIDLHTVAALMTIVGYSLNDTIIIFDRIREDMGTMRHSPLREIVNHSINQTFSRTINTSLTTFVVLVILVFFGGASIFSFSLIMAIGVIFGTSSSMFIAAPLLLFFDKREKAPTKEISPT